jgi:hypothetical protein
MLGDSGREFYERVPLDRGIEIAKRIVPHFRVHVEMLGHDCFVTIPYKTDGVTLSPESKNRAKKLLEKELCYG